MEFGQSSLHDAAMTAERTPGFTAINLQHWSLRYLPPWARPYGRRGLGARPPGRCGRERRRPLAAGEVTLRTALIWMVLQSAIGAAVLFKLNKFAGGVALCSLILVAVYPTMKRFTYWPQVVLGLAFNWGALVGYAAVTGTLSWAAIALYVGGVTWTLIYDTIYAMQDQRDDAIIG